MHVSIAQAREALAALCRCHHIARLEVFGSAARRDFESLLGRHVDLVQADAVRNPFVLCQIEQERELLDAA